MGEHGEGAVAETRENSQSEQRVMYVAGENIHHDNKGGVYIAGDSSQQDQGIIYVTEGTAKMDMQGVMSPESMDYVNSPEVLVGNEILQEEQHGPMEFRVQFVNGKMENYSSPQLMSRFRKDDTEKLMKILRDAASRPMDDGGMVEPIDVDTLVHEDLNRMPVRKLRSLIPRLLVLCYFSPEEISGKRKMKHVWEKRPADWPLELPFKDPNNGGSDKHKPGKTDLLKMGMFLKDKYLKDVKRCVTHPVHDDRQPTMETATNVPTVTSLSPETMDLMPTEALLERLRKKMVHLVWGFSREKPDHMRMLQKAYSVVYEHYQNSKASAHHKFMFLDSGHWFENIADQLLLGRQFSDRELEGRLMAIYGVNEEDMENMTNQMSMQTTRVMTSLTQINKSQFMDGYFQSHIKEEPCSPKMGYLMCDKEVPNLGKTLDASQLNIKIRGETPLQQLALNGNLQHRPPPTPDPEFTYKIPDKITKYDTNGQVIMELSEQDKMMTAHPLFANNKQDLDSSHNSIMIPSQQPAETVFPTSTPSDCVMEGSTPVMCRQNSLTNPTSNASYSLMQESKDPPPSYYDHMQHNRTHQLAVSGQNYPGYHVTMEGLATCTSSVSQSSTPTPAPLTAITENISAGVSLTSVSLPQVHMQENDHASCSLTEATTTNGSSVVRGEQQSQDETPWDDILSVLSADQDSPSSCTDSTVLKMESSSSPECSLTSDNLSAAFHTLNNGSASLSQTNESLPITVSEYIETNQQLITPLDSRKKRIKVSSDCMGANYMKKMKR